ncbi:MAG: response regulator [Patescibacteria group bacterium]|nr:response regulator [Patescibacteria group bacterium]
MKKILIIEDDSFLSEMYETKLAQSGFEVETAFDGKTGLSKAKDGSYDLILLDIVLPKMDGFEVLREIKKLDSAIKETPVVLLTNLGQKNEVEKGVGLGADEYIIKAHFTPTAVVDKIKKLLKE